MPNWAFFLVRLFFGVGGSALITWLGWKAGGYPWALIGLVFSAPLIGVAIARPLVELIHEGFGWLSAQPLKQWHGNYYEFGGVHVRVYEGEGELWFVAVDVMRATGLPAPRPAAPGTGRVIDGTRLQILSIDEVESVLLAHPSHESSRFILWAQREVVTPWERKRSGALVPAKFGDP